MTSRIIINRSDLDLWIAYLLSRRLPISVSSIDGRDRTGQQNQLQWLWATEAARQRGDVTSEEVQREWKLRHGVPILREDDADFRASWDRLIKRNHSYEQKVELMRFIDVTSDMKVKQMVRFLDAVQRECAEQGIKLTDPDPDLAAYQARYRTKEAA